MTTLFDQLRQLDLPRGQYAVFGSGPLVVRGIIPLGHDLDVICREEAWQAVRKLGRIESLPGLGVEIVSMQKGQLTFGRQWGIGDFEIDALIETAELIDGLPFVRLEHVVSYKNIRASAKDLVHLQALEESGTNY